MRLIALPLLLLVAACSQASAPADVPSAVRSSAASVAANTPVVPGVTAPTNGKKKGWREFIKPSDAELRERLTPLQYQVTQEEGTEQPFQNAYFDNHEAGIYVDIVSGEPLFSSKEKYDSGTGWPSFWKPLMPENIVTKTDTLLGYERTEVRSKRADSHLGHLFDDGPQPTGLRYCMDSASLRFIPVAELKNEGYGEFEAMFH